MFGDGRKTVAGYSDASFAPKGGKSQSCFLVLWHGDPVFLKTMMQTFVTLSAAECELVAACDGWVAVQSVAVIVEELRQFVVTKSLHVDNAAAISIGGSSNNIHWRTRHLRLRAAAMHEAVEEKWLHPLKVPGRRQLADVGAKALGQILQKSMRFLLGMEELGEEDASRTRLFVATVSRAQLIAAMKCPDCLKNTSRGDSFCAKRGHRLPVAEDNFMPEDELAKSKSDDPQSAEEEQPDE